VIQRATLSAVPVSHAEPVALFRPADIVVRGYEKDNAARVGFPGKALYTIATVFRAEYDRLKAGFRAEEIEQARARRDRAAAVLQKLVAGPRLQEIEIAQEQLNVARADLELAQSEYDRLVGLRAGDQAAKLEFEQAERALKASRAKLIAAEKELVLLKEGTRSEEIAEARAALAEAQQALGLLEAGYRGEEMRPHGQSRSSHRGPDPALV